MAVKFKRRLMLLWPDFVESRLIDGVNVREQLHFLDCSASGDDAATTAPAGPPGAYASHHAHQDSASGCGCGCDCASSSGTTRRIVVLSHGFSPDDGPRYALLCVLRLTLSRLPGRWTVVVPDFRPSYAFGSARGRSERVRLVQEEILVALVDAQSRPLGRCPCSRSCTCCTAGAAAPGAGTTLDTAADTAAGAAEGSDGACAAGGSAAGSAPPGEPPFAVVLVGHSQGGAASAQLCASDRLVRVANIVGLVMLGSESPMEVLPRPPFDDGDGDDSERVIHVARPTALPSTNILLLHASNDPVISSGSMQHVAERWQVPCRVLVSPARADDPTSAWSADVQHDFIALDLLHGVIQELAAFLERVVARPG